MFCQPKHPHNDRSLGFSIRALGNVQCFAAAIAADIKFCYKRETDDVLVANFLPIARGCAPEIKIDQDLDQPGSYWKMRKMGPAMTAVPHVRHAGKRAKVWARERLQEFSAADLSKLTVVGLELRRITMAGLSFLHPQEHCLVARTT